MNSYDNLLTLILEYKMTKEEACALKLVIIYLQSAQEIFPEYKHYLIPKKRDIRRCELFKYCIKLYRETKDKITFAEYRSYIQAQMIVLKNISVNGTPSLLSPNMLVGEKAWARWKVWQKFSTNTKSVEKEEPKVNISVIKLCLERTKAFMGRNLGELTTDKIKQALNNKAIFRWVATGRMSPYYLIMSPLATEWIENNNINLLSFGIDVNVYKNNITPEANEYFKGIFALEFNV
jgi:hypothetical protein